MNSRCDMTSILDIPDKVLIQIIWYLDARERIPLGNSCVRFHSLVFEDQRVLRNLDFSKALRTVKAKNILEYFKNEKTYAKIINIKLNGDIFPEPKPLLFIYVRKATNLVDINVRGFKFQSIQELEFFLKPLIHVQRLSIHWPNAGDGAVPSCKLLQKSFGQLRYLWVRIEGFLLQLARYLQQCKQLEELHIQTYGMQDEYPWNLKPTKLKNLKIVSSDHDPFLQIKAWAESVLPDPLEWTDFRIHRFDLYLDEGFHFEKNVEVCEELLERKFIERNRKPNSEDDFNLGWCLRPENLLQEVIEITHQDVPKTFNCFSYSEFDYSTIDIGDAKLLLKNPRHQISSLFIYRNIGSNSDAHLLVSAFPNLTKLCIHNIVIETEMPSAMIHPERRLKRRGIATSDESNYLKNINKDSSFKMLVANTPNLRELEIDGRARLLNYTQELDCDAFHLIADWKNLTTLRILNLLTTDAKFLIAVGKECTNLEILELSSNERGDCNHGTMLLQMLDNHRKLKEISVQKSFIEKASTLFYALSKHTDLRMIKIPIHYITSDNLDFLTENQPYASLPSTDLKSSIEEMLRCCSKLTTFIFHVKCFARDDVSEYVERDLKKLKEKVDLPIFNYEIEVLRQFVCLSRDLY